VNYMFKDGFLPTDAPLFMDEVMVVVAMLPFLVAFAISQVKKGNIKLHIKLQILIFILGILFVGYFEYGARVMGGFAPVLAKSSLNHTFLYIFLAFHVLIAIATTFLWSYSIYFGLRYHEKISKKSFRYSHVKIAKPTFLGITLTSVTGVLLYIFIYIF